mgnify:CR=1 FL=1
MTTETWRNILPELPLSEGVPVIDVSRNGLGQMAYRVDLERPQGWRYAVGLLMARTANEDRARREWPEAWQTAQAIWSGWGLSSGNHYTPADCIRLARALRQVFPC